jgi:hypothetical protein
VIFDGQHQQATATLRRLFESQGVDLCGRYGSWTYNSMEDCLLEGRKVARRLTAGPAPSSTAVPRR